MFTQLASLQNLRLAFQKAKKLKGRKRDIVEYEYYLETNLCNLKRELEERTYAHGSYKSFVVKDPKLREIKAAPFRDRVLHHAVCNLAMPIFEKGFVRDSYACRNGKGIHKALKRLKKFLQAIHFETHKEIYCLKCDIRKYFASIDHEILFSKEK